MAVRRSEPRGSLLLVARRVSGGKNEGFRFIPALARRCDKRSAGSGAGFRPPLSQIGGAKDREVRARFREKSGLKPALRLVRRLLTQSVPRRATSLFALAVLPCVALAHPIHRAIAEADYNREKQTLQVALRVYADDFQDALSAHAKKKISLEKTPAAEVDMAIRAYLIERFTVKSADGTLADQKWIGRELRDAENELWLYFEVPLRGGIDGAKIHHGLLGEHFGDQLNSVQIRDGTRKVTLVFLPNHREKTVRFAH